MRAWLFQLIHDAVVSLAVAMWLMILAHEMMYAMDGLIGTGWEIYG